MIAIGFLVLLVTGVYLTFFFQPSTNEVIYDGSYEPLQGVSMTEAYDGGLREVRRRLRPQEIDGGVIEVGEPKTEPSPALGPGGFPCNMLGQLRRVQVRAEIRCREPEEDEPGGADEHPEKPCSPDPAPEAAEALVLVQAAVERD